MSITNNAVNVIALTTDSSGNLLIFCGSDGGLDRIAPDGSVSSFTDATGTFINVQNVTTDTNYVYFTVGTTASNSIVLRQPLGVALTDTAYTNWIVYNGTNTAVWTSAINPIHYGGATSIIQGAV